MSRRKVKVDEAKLKVARQRAYRRFRRKGFTHVQALAFAKQVLEP